MPELELNLDDVLDDEETVETKTPTKKASPKKSTKVNKSEQKSENDKLRELTKGLPSAKLAKYDLYRQAPRVQWAISNVPDIIKIEAEKKAEELGLSKKEFFYHCLRKAGVYIPEDKYLDSRKIIR